MLKGVAGVVGDDGQAACQREIFQGIARKQRRGINWLAAPSDHHI
jgi:hypothetical protein